MNVLIILSEAAMNWPDAFAAVGVPLAILLGLAAMMWAANQ